ncbi:putative RNA polymerase III subunit C17 [Handroanthus impetiginosus]|uniref:DNA-directed RNA polymerase III subunit RPC9 n=1 Tax=Handroanthus impetiginosus TaxID=429701 RepID=A0A2G9FYB7_9LAMI|nr:putative RNA polymerase III subunit C17 [Handroanthus impetiginosus]
MKIVEANAGALTNFEVLDLLRSRGAGKDPTRVIASVSPSEFKVFDYLEQTPACNQTGEIVHKFVDECKKYDLAKAEILNVLNMRPSSAVEVYTIIEECDSRMDEKIDEYVETIVRSLPPHPSHM